MVSSPPLILAIDHGTSGIKAALVTALGEVVDHAFEPTPTRFSPGGGAEQDPDDWWRALIATSRALLARRADPAAPVEAVCVSSTWSTTVATAADGRPAMPALTWMDGRGADLVRARMRGVPSIAGYGLLNLLRWVPRTGGGPTLSGKDDVAHALLVQHRFPDAYARTAHFLPSKDWLNLRLCGEVASSPDAMALFWVADIRDLADVRYDDRLIRRLGLDRDRLPPLRPSASVLGTLTGEAADALGLPRATRVIVGSPDHQSALVGSGAVDDFAGHLYVGTSSWLECPVPFRKTDVLHSIASLPSAMPDRYQVVDEQDVAGGALAWLVERAGVGSFAELDALAAAAAPGAGGVLATPWLNGERTPVDDPRLRASLHGLSTTTTAADVVRAVFEGVACNTRWMLGPVERFVGRPLSPLVIVGGGARSDLWCQLFADVLDRPLRRPHAPRQANARGAALIAAVALGHLRFDEVAGRVPIEREFTPDPTRRALYDELFGQFVARARVERKLAARGARGG